MSPTKSARRLTLVLSVLLAGAGALLAQVPIATNAASPPARLDLTGGGGVGARALANQANNPAEPLTLVQLRDVWAPSVPGFDSGANVLQIDPVLPIFPSRLLPFEQILKLTLQIPTTPSPGSKTGFGDTALFDLISIKQSWAGGLSGRPWSFRPRVQPILARASGRPVRPWASSIPASKI